MLRLALDDPRWLEFVRDAAHSPFHRPAWARLIADCYGYRAFALGLIDESGRLKAGLPIIEADLPSVVGAGSHFPSPITVPRSPCRALWERMLEPGLGFVLLAYAGGVPIAGAVFLASDGTVIYKYSASKREAWSLRPNDLLLWTAIRWAIENDFRLFDFGRTPSSQHGLRAFKAGWTDEHVLAYSTIARRPSGMSLARWAGVGSLVRHSPPWVARYLGELFYRFAA
jgi:hypothetical protein